MGHRNAIITAERDNALKELNELKTKYAEASKKKMTQIRLLRRRATKRWSLRESRMRQF